MKFFSALLLVFSALSLNAQTNCSTEIQNFLPSAKCNVDVMGLAWPKRYLELTEKLQSVISTNKDWWLDYVKKNAKGGERLPYTSKFGLTKKEYDEFLSLADKRTLEKIGSGILLVKTNSSGFEFDGGAKLADLTGIKINIKKLTVTTPFAILKNPTQKESPGGPVFGAYSGCQWNLEQSDLDKGDELEASFLIGKLKESGRYFIYYKGGLMKVTNLTSDVRIVICYDK